MASLYLYWRFATSSKPPPKGETPIYFDRIGEAGSKLTDYVKVSLVRQGLVNMVTYRQGGATLFMNRVSRVLIQI
jgi:hypothetical protein